MSRTPTPEEARRATVLAASGGWERPAPLGGLGRLPDFPCESLPRWGAAMVAAIADFTQTPPDLAGVVYLGVLAAAAGGRAEVEVRSGWREPVNLYAAPAMPPGTRKSAVFREMTAPLLDAEMALQEAARSSITEAAVAAEISQQQARKAVEAAAKIDPKDHKEAADDAKANAIALADYARSVEVPAWPRLFADDATAEALTSLLAQQGGRIAVLSAEGDLFDIMSGRYSRDGQTANLGVFLKGHAGDLLLVDRKGREPERIGRPALTIVVTIQPQVLLDIARRPALRGRGLLARILYCLPPDNVGFRRIDADPVAEGIAGTYRQKVTALALSLADWTDPAALILTPEARKLLAEYQEEIEPRLRAEGGDLADVRDWAAKLAGATVRIAGLLHLADDLERGWANPVSQDTMRQAIDLGRYFTEHARAAFRQMGMDPLISDAETLLAWIKRTRSAEFSKRDLFRGVQNDRFKKAIDVDEPLALLVDHGYVRAVQSSAPGKTGRPASPRYESHPELLC
jgi:replicative DNA helicase